MAATDSQSQLGKKVVRACDLCHKKKIKCDTTSPPCSNCVSYKKECTFTYIEKPRKTPLRSAKRIDTLESRLERIEALLKEQNPTSSDGNAATRIEEAKAQPADTHPSQPHARVDVSKAPDRERSDVIAKSSLNSDRLSASGAEDGKKAHTEDSPISFLPSHDYYTERNDEASLPQDNQHIVAAWEAKRIYGNVQRRTNLPLPPTPEARSLLQEYFDNLNCVFPLFHQASFMSIFWQRNTRAGQDDPTWWAALNVVLSLANRLRAMNTLDSREHNHRAWGYLQNALDVVTKLTLHDTDLMGVQALLGMAVILQGTPNPCPASMLLATAIRLAHNLGLNKQIHNTEFNEIETEQRNRVFWIAYVLDKDFSLRLDQPPMINNDDVDARLPSASPEDGLGYIHVINGTSMINYFRLRVELSIIQGKIYSRLYSVRALKASRHDRLLAIERLDRMLDAWKRSIPSDFRPENLQSSVTKSSIIHVVILQLTYFNCLSLVHCISFQNRHWTTNVLNSFRRSIEANRCDASQTLCISAARSSMRTVRLAPQGDFACIWVILYYYVSGLVILLANIIHNPEQEMARADMDLVEPLLRLLDLLAENAKTEDSNRIRNFCMELERRATIALGKVHIKDIARPNRKRKVDSMTTQDLTLDQPVLGRLDSNAETTAGLVEAPRVLDLGPTKITRPDASLIADTTNTMDWTELFPELHIPAVGPGPDGYNLDELDKFMMNTVEDSNKPSAIDIVSGSDSEPDFMYLLSEWGWQGPSDGSGETTNHAWDENVSAPLQSSGQM